LKKKKGILEDALNQRTILVGALKWKPTMQPACMLTPLHDYVMNKKARTHAHVYGQLPAWEANSGHALVWPCRETRPSLFTFIGRRACWSNHAYVYSLHTQPSTTSYLYL